MRRAVAIASTLAGVCLLEGLSKLGRSPTELIYADGRLGDVPGFNEEAQMQWKSGEVRGEGKAEPRLERENTTACRLAGLASSNPQPRNSRAGVPLPSLRLSSH